MNHFHSRSIQTLSFPLLTHSFHIWRAGKHYQRQGSHFLKHDVYSNKFRYGSIFMSNVYFHYRCDYCSSAIPLRGGVTLSVTCKVVGPTSNSKLMVGTRYLSRLLGLPSIHACVCLPHPGTHSMFKHCYCQRYSFTLFAFFSTV